MNSFNELNVAELARTEGGADFGVLNDVASLFGDFTGGVASGVGAVLNPVIGAIAGFLGSIFGV